VKVPSVRAGWTRTAFSRSFWPPSAMAKKLITAMNGNPTMQALSIDVRYLPMLWHSICDVNLLNH
jgi:hypothetical protein